VDDWWSEIDDAVLACLIESGGSGADDIGRRLGMSTEAAVSILGMLAQEGRVRISRAEAVEGRGRRRGSVRWIGADGVRAG
jgi:predicted ArsR family transcriptional regulator